MSASPRGAREPVADNRGPSATSRPIERQRGPGRPFAPGTSGNPGGRPKGFAAAVRSRTREGAMLISLMVDMVQGKPIAMETIFPPKEPGQPPTIVKYQRTPEPRDRIAATQWLADRGWGRATQHMEVSGLSGAPKAIREMSTEELQQFLHQRLSGLNGTAKP